MEFVGCTVFVSVAMVIVALPGAPATAKVKPSGTVTGAIVAVSHHVVVSTSSISTSNAVESPRLVTTRSTTTTLFEAAPIVFVMASRGSITSTFTTPLVETGGFPS